MSKEPRELTAEEKAVKREKLDRVLAAALAERTNMLSLYDCAVWLLYACTRSDAIASAKEMVQQGEEEFEDHTIRDEIDDQLDLVYDDDEVAKQHELDIKAIGEELDPDFDSPALELTDWLPNIYDAESAQVLRRVVDNAIDSSRRAAARKPEK